MTIDLNKLYQISENVIAKEIEEELVIVPVRSGIGDLDAEMFGLNQTGIAVWNRLDGTLSPNDIIKELTAIYNAPPDEIRSDVTELIMQLLAKGLVVEL
jgi:hypothetical protein